MNGQILVGILLISTGAFSASNFAVPFGKIKGWKWETYWMIYGLGAYIFFPFIACLVFALGFIEVIEGTSFKVLSTVFLLGAVYGIGNLSFGLTLRYLRLSLGYALSLGLMLAIGTLIPPVLDGRLQIMIQNSGGKLLIMGMIVACAGIALSAWAGILKDKQLSEEKKHESISEFNLLKGLLAAGLVGIAGSAMSLGFEKAIPVSDLALAKGVDPLFAMMPVMMVLLPGTFVTTIIWCTYFGIKNNSLKDYSKAETGKVLSLNYLFGLLAGLLWFSQFIVYGMGRSKMGHYTFTSWGDTYGADYCFFTVWGDHTLRMERSLCLDCFSYGYVVDNPYNFFIHDWCKRFGIMIFQFQI